MWLLVQSFEKHASGKSRHHGRLTWRGSGRSQVVAVSSILDWVMEVVVVSSIQDWVMEVVVVLDPGLGDGGCGCPRSWIG